VDFRAGLTLEFETPDRERFPCLDLAYSAIAKGGAYPAVLNAANEEAVQAFLDGRASFTTIPECVSETLGAVTDADAATLDAVLAADAWARRQARTILKAAPRRAAS
jgi:1-deoxy-D-xylulose-5-phosphate reductoisomerase